MTDKVLKFQAVLDEPSFARVKRALGELNTEASKLAKTLQGAGGFFGGANIGKPPSAVQTQGRGGAGVSGGKSNFSVGQAILGDVEAFRKLAQSGKTGMTAMTDAVRKGVRDQMQEIEKLDRKMATLQSRFNAAHASGLPDDVIGPRIRNIQMQMLARRGQRTSAVGQMNDLMGAEADLGPDRQPPKPGMLSRFASSVGASGVAPTGIGGWAKVGGIVAAGAMAALNESMAGTRTYARQEDARSQLVNSDIRRIRGGDITGMIALKSMLSDSGRKADFKDQAGLGAQAEALRNGLVQSGMAAANSATGGIFNIGGGGAIGEGLSTASRNTAQAQNAIEQARKYENSTAFLNKKMALEQFYGDFSDRKQLGRVFGYGLNRDKDGRVHDSASAYDARMTAAGFSGSEGMAGYVNARSLGGRQFANANSFRVMSAQAAGYGGYGELLAAAAKSGRNNSALLALGGKIDTTAGIQLGQGILGNGFDPRGTTGGSGILRAAQGPGFNFTGGTTDFNQVQQILAAQQLGSSITSGGMDTYQAGRNVISAVGVNPGGTTYAQDYLGTGMSLKQMMDGARGDLTKTAQAMGLDKDMMRMQLSNSMGSVMDRYVEQGGSDPMSKAVRGFRSSGKSIDSYLNSLYKTGNAGDRQQAEAIGAYFGMVSGEGEEAGLGLAGLLGGLDTKGKGKRGPGAGRGQIESLVDRQIADTVNKNGQALEAMFDDMKSSLEKAPEAVKLMATFGENLSADTEQFLQALENLSTAMNLKAYEISKGQVGSAESKAASKPSNYTPYVPGSRSGK
jgi:hypothetical protein